MVSSMTVVVGRYIVDAAFVASLLLLSAGTTDWPRAWVLVAVLLVIRLAGAIAVHRVHPTLLQERAKSMLHRDQPWPDRLLVLAVIVTGFAALYIIAGLDVFRWHALPPPPPLLSAIGLFLFAAGWTIKMIALRTNAFAIVVVRLQRDRQHAVVDTGVYGIVRHPFYAGTPLVLIGLGLWLESTLTVVCSVVPIALMLVRLVHEERFLRRELPGYTEYAERVRYRLIPGVW